MISFRGAVELFVCTNEKKEERIACTFCVFAENTQHNWGWCMESVQNGRVRINIM